MTDFASLLAADRGQKARPIHLVDKQSFAAWVKGRPAEDRALLAAHRFDGKTGFAFVLLPRGNTFEVDTTGGVVTLPSGKKIIVKTGSMRAKDLAPTVTCLLYTSPSPRDGLLSRMPSSA